ncbi:MAG: hypothetical protein DRH24_11480 [Deltaproteobacteria bacterium]|nr:MAG: hypothetical protein DRH24_11480 [Deltaproteobacteria bacterium]
MSLQDANFTIHPLFYYNTISTSNNHRAERYKALFPTYAFTGIRRSEALALGVVDYDSISNIINLPIVCYSLQKYSNYKMLIFYLTIMQL